MAIPGLATHYFQTGKGVNKSLSPWQLIEATYNFNLEGVAPFTETTYGLFNIVGKIKNDTPITVKLQFYKQSTNTHLYTHEYLIPTPQSEGWEWWDWYSVEAHIGTWPHEINEDGEYRVTLDVQYKGNVEIHEDRIVTVTGVGPPTPPPPEDEGSIEVALNPSNARIVSIPLDINRIGGFSMTGIKQGEYPCTVSADEYITQNFVIHITANELTKHSFALKEEEPEPPPPPKPEDITPEEYKAWWLTLTPAERVAALIEGRFREDVYFDVDKEIAMSIAVGMIGAGPAVKAVSVGAAERALISTKLKKMLTEEEIIRRFGHILKTGAKTGASKAEIEVAIAKIIDQGAIKLLGQSIPWYLKGFALVKGAMKKWWLYLGAAMLLGWWVEEVSQSTGFSLYPAIDTENWELAQKYLPLEQAFLYAVKPIADLLGIIPIIGTLVTTSWTQGETQLKIYEELIELELEKIEGIGTLAVKTTPTGATIWIDNRQQKYPSNSVIDDVAIGARRVRVELKGHKEYEETATIREGETTEFIHSFEVIEDEIPAGAGRLQYEVVDDKTNGLIGASFFIGGRLEKAYASTYAVNLKAGVYELRWSAIGYENYEDTVAIQEGELTDLKVRLKKMEGIEEPFEGVTCETLGYHTEKPIDGREYVQTTARGLVCWTLKEANTGVLELSSNPPAEVWLLGVKLADSTPIRLDLEQGMYDITLKAEGYFDENIRVYLNAGQTIVRAVALSKIDEVITGNKVWRVDINSSPTSAKILVNFGFTGKYTPDYILLDPGEYLISLTKSGYKQYDVPIILEEISNA